MLNDMNASIIFNVGRLSNFRIVIKNTWVCNQDQFKNEFMNIRVT